MVCVDRTLCEVTQGRNMKGVMVNQLLPLKTTRIWSVGAPGATEVAKMAVEVTNNDCWRVRRQFCNSVIHFIKVGGVGFLWLIRTSDPIR